MQQNCELLLQCERCHCLRSLLALHILPGAQVLMPNVSDGQETKVLLYYSSSFYTAILKGLCINAHSAQTVQCEIMQYVHLCVLDEVAHGHFLCHAFEQALVKSNVHVAGNMRSAQCAFECSDGGEWNQFKSDQG